MAIIYLWDTSVQIGNDIWLRDPTTFVPSSPVTSAGGLHSIWEGIGDPGVGVICQTMHTIEQGISA
jgi:hypothetical protein